MGTRDPRVDAYIARAGDFARPVLNHLRETVHAACPDVEETVKWGMPYFMYHGMLCGMAAFKRHCAFHFWRGAEVAVSPVEPGGEASGEGAKGAMGQFGRIMAVADLPPKRVLAGYVKRAMRRNEQGRPSPGRTKPRAARPPRAIAVPPDLAAALDRAPRARSTFEGFSPSHRREYIEWITGAKRPETRARRLATALEWIAEGKPQNWKYMRPQDRR